VRRTVLGAALALAGLGAVASPTVAAPPTLWQAGETGSGAGQSEIPRGVGVAPATAPNRGHVFVTDQVNSRVVEFTTWGIFVKAWGWDVAPDGAPGDTATDQFEICTVSCKAGSAGAGTGQFGAESPQGIAVDSSGNVYVVDRGLPSNARVQKFDADGNFLRMWGKDVNKTKVDEAAPEVQRDLCTAASGDVCQAGVIGTGSGQFGNWPVTGSYIAAGPDDRIYVGDVGRIQHFNSDGEFQGQISEGMAATEKVKSLAVGPTGALYAAIDGQADVRRWGAFPGHAPLSSVTVASPQALAVDSDQNLYAASGSSSPLILQLDVSGNKVDEWGQEEPPSPKLGSLTTGLAASDACLSAGSNVYVASAHPAGTGSFARSFVRAYGPAPDPGVCGAPPLVPPAITAQRALSVGTDSATLRATINPEFWDDARYYVQYGTGKCSEGGCENELPVPPGLLLTDGIGNQPIPSAPITLAGLESGTTYNYRFVAESSGGGPVFGVGATGAEPQGEEASFTTFAPLPIVTCPNQKLLRIGPGAFLPDCRAYEQVSPVDKESADAVAPNNVADPPAEEAHFRASPDGKKVSYASARAFGDAKAGPFSISYIASRSADGWSSHSITPPQEDNIDAGPPAYAWNRLMFLSEGLETMWHYTDFDPQLHPDGVTGFKNLYRTDIETDAHTPITTVAPPTASPEQGDFSYNPMLTGFAADGSSTVYAANDKLVADASDATAGGGRPIYQLYEQRDGEPSPRLVSRLPGEAASDQHSVAGGGLTALEGAVSEDGSRIYWTSGESTGINSISVVQSGSASGRIYVRVDGTETVPVSETVPVDPGGSEVARFWMGAKDGSAALLTMDASVFTPGEELYRFDLASESSTKVADGGVRGVAGASEDLSRVYFVSTQVLDPEPNSHGEVAEAGNENAYLYEEGEGVRFIAAPDISAVGGAANATLSMFSGDLATRVGRVTPDGGALVFLARNPLTGFDSTGDDGKGYTQVFRYSADSDQLNCASCNPTGAQPMGRTVLNRYGNLSGTIPGWRQGPYHQQRALADDGNRVFFESFDRLVARDTNDALDVYQWQAPGTSDCSTASPSYSDTTEGCVDLISSGEDEGPSHFIEATPTGETVFLRSAEQLVGQDKDNLFDIYAAPEGGGLASQHPDPPPPPCDPGSSCPGKGSTPPANLGAGSAAIQHAGNVVESNCGEIAKRARKLLRRAGALRRRASRLDNVRRSKRLRRKSARSAKRGRAVRKRTRLCRARARANPNGRAGR
jgi:hypothetical protein